MDIDEETNHKTHNAAANGAHLNDAAGGAADPGAGRAADDHVAVGGTGGDTEAVSRFDFGPVVEPPARADWQPGKPGFIARWLIRMSGVDPNLALKMPADEQLQMKRVGAAQLSGSTFQCILIAVTLGTGYGFQPWTAPVILVVAAILWFYDSKIIAGDWIAKGQTLCRAYGLMPEEAWGGRLRRIAALLARFGLAACIAWTFAVFVLLDFFEPAILQRWADEHRVKNRELVQTVTASYLAEIADTAKQIKQSDGAIETLVAERTGLARAAPSFTADIDRQINDHLEHIKKLEASGDAAQDQKDAERRDVIAEQYGVRARDGNTGLAGKGTQFHYSAAMAKEYEAVAAVRAAAVETDTKAIADLRQQRSAIQATAIAANRAKSEAIEDRLSQARQTRAKLAAEYRTLQDNRERWITNHVSESPGYVAMPSGIIAKLEALAAITTSNWLLASLAFFVKCLVMLLECAGPIAKVIFTTGGLYSMAVALRLHDAAEMEADRRLKWEHWRIMARGRNHDAIEAGRAKWQRRATEARARDALHKIMDKMPWVH